MPAVTPDKSQQHDPPETSIPPSGRDEAVPVRCPQCHAPIDYPMQSARSTVTCGSCGTSFQLLSANEPSGTAQPPSHIAHFELIEVLGVGAFGAVWKAHDIALDRIVALKIPRRNQLDPLQEEQFLREARAAAQLRHPGIVSVYEVGRDDESLYIASEFIEGLNLAQWQERNRPTFCESANLCREIALALAHAHAAGVVHRDLKPSNVMIDAQGHAHLMDFGLAKREAVEITVTADGSILGTPTHMSPEQARGEAHTVDGRTDLYSLGVVLYQLLTDELPFRGNARMLLQQVLHDDPPNPRRLNNQIPRDLETICLKCLEKEPDRRYASAVSLAEDLRLFAEGRPIQARPISRFERARRWCGRNRAVAALAASTALLLLAVAVGSLIAAVTIARQRNEAIAERDRNQRFVDYFVEVFRRPDPSIDGRDVTVASVLNKASADAKRELAEEPFALASLLRTFGSTYLELGIYPEAIDCLEQASGILERELGADHVDTIRTLNALGMAYEAAGEMDKALDIIDHVTNYRRAHLGESHPDTLGSMTTLAKVHRQRGEMDRSITLLRDVLTRRQVVLGDDHPETLAAMNNLADLYKSTGQASAALPLLESALPLIQEKYGEDHFQTAATMNTLASTYRQLGQVNKAIPLFEKSHEIMQEQLGDRHSYTLTMLHNLAGAYRTSGRAAEALPLFEQAVALRRETLGESHLSTLSSMNGLAVCYEVLDQPEKALPLYESAYDAMVSNYGTSHPQTLMLMVNLAKARRREGHVDEAVKLLEQALTEYRAQSPSNEADLVHCMTELAETYDLAGREHDANTLRQQAEQLQPIDKP